MKGLLINSETEQLVAARLSQLDHRKSSPDIRDVNLIKADSTFAIITQTTWFVFWNLNFMPVFSLESCIIIKCKFSERKKDNS